MRVQIKINVRAVCGVVVDLDSPDTWGSRQNSVKRINLVVTWPAHLKTPAHPKAWVALFLSARGCGVAVSDRRYTANRCDHARDRAGLCLDLPDVLAAGRNDNSTARAYCKGLIDNPALAGISRLDNAFSIYRRARHARKGQIDVRRGAGLAKRSCDA